MKPETIKQLRKWLGEDGIKFFTDVKQKYGRIDAVWIEDSIPHPVHFREGMQVRNFLRDTKECRDWDAIKLDENWVKFIEKAIENEKSKN